MNKDISQNTQYKIVDADKPDEEIMSRAGQLIAEGELVAFPTETVYGLGGNAFDPTASARIYAAKGRPSDNPLIVHIADLTDMTRVGVNIPEEAYLLAEHFWPGPLTMIVERNENVPLATTGGLNTVAIRMPNHQVALELIKKSNCPIAAPSANTSGRPSPTLGSHVREDLDGKIAMILDGGPVGIGIESTIIDLTEEVPMVLRPGYITPAMLSKVMGKEVIIDPGILSMDDTKKPKAPGMKYKHYAPKGNLVLVEGATKKVIDEINARAKKDQEQGHKTLVIATEETKNLYQADMVLSIGAREKEEDIARHLYAILRDCDSLGADQIYSESFSTPVMGQAIMNRLLKAAGHEVILVDE